jgi:hypothetical protein
VDWDDLSSETLKSGSSGEGQTAGSAEGTVLRISFDNDQLALVNYQ